MGPAAVPVWLLQLQLQMSSVENVSHYLYTSAIYIKLCKWIGITSNLNCYILCAALLFLWIIPYSWKIEARGQRKNIKLKKIISKLYENLLRDESTMGSK